MSFIKKQSIQSAMLPLDYSQALERFFKKLFHFNGTVKTRAGSLSSCQLSFYKWLGYFLYPCSSEFLFLLLLFVFKQASLLLL